MYLIVLTLEYIENKGNNRNLKTPFKKPKNMISPTFKSAMWKMKQLNILNYPNKKEQRLYVQQQESRNILLKQEC